MSTSAPTHTGKFKIGTLHAAMFKRALDAILNPAYDLTRLPDGTVRFHRRT